MPVFCGYHKPIFGSVQKSFHLFRSFRVGFAGEVFVFRSACGFDVGQNCVSATRDIERALVPDNVVVSTLFPDTVVKPVESAKHGYMAPA